MLINIIAQNPINMIMIRFTTKKTMTTESKENHRIGDGDLLRLKMELLTIINEIQKQQENTDKYVEGIGNDLSETSIKVEKIWDGIKFFSIGIILLFALRFIKHLLT